MLSLCFLMFIFVAIEKSMDGEGWNSPNNEDWWIIIGGFSLFFIITMGLFLRIDLIRKFIQVITVLSMIAWTGFAIFIFQQIDFQLETRGRFDRDIFPFIGVSISFLAYMIGLFTLFGNGVVKEEFRASLDRRFN